MIEQPQTTWQDVVIVFGVLAMCAGLMLRIIW